MFIFKIVIMLYRYMHLSKFVTIWLMGRAVHHPVANVAMEKLVILWTVRALMGVQKAQQEISVNTVWQFCSLHAFRCLIVFTLLKKAGIFNYICDKKWQIDIISMSTVSLGCPLIMAKTVWTNAAKTVILLEGATVSQVSVMEGVNQDGSA